MNRIAELRKARGLSQGDLALLLGVNVRTVAAWEAAEQTPRARHAKGLARRLGVTVEQLGLEDGTDVPAD